MNNNYNNDTCDDECSCRKSTPKWGFLAAFICPIHCFLSPLLICFMPSFVRSRNFEIFLIICAVSIVLLPHLNYKKLLCNESILKFVLVVGATMWFILSFVEPQSHVSFSIMGGIYLTAVNFVHLISRNIPTT